MIQTLTPRRNENSPLSSNNTGSNVDANVDANANVDVDANVDANDDAYDDGRNDLVKVNVGGKIFLQVLRSTLCQAPDDALFTRMFSKDPHRTSYHNYNGHQAPVTIHYDEQSRIFLDHDPELMEIIINFMRTKQIEDPFDPIVEPPQVPPHKRKDFRRLLNHFGLTAFFFYPTNVYTTITNNNNNNNNYNNTTRSIRSMSIDEEQPHHVLDVVTVTKDSVSSDQSSVADEEVGNNNNNNNNNHNHNETTAVVPCPLGYDYCYG